MGISKFEFATVACARCGCETHRYTWLIVDAVERPDLVNRLRDGTDMMHSCKRCGHADVRTAPVIVARLALDVPLIVGCPTATYPEELASIAKVSLLSAYGVTTIWAPSVALQMIPIVLRRDISRDLDNVDDACDRISNSYREDYRAFLKEIDANNISISTSEAMDKLLTAESVKEIEEILTARPLLTSGAANAFLEQCFQPSVLERSPYAEIRRLVASLEKGQPAEGIAEFLATLRSRRAASMALTREQLGKLQEGLFDHNRAARAQCCRELLKVTGGLNTEEERWARDRLAITLLLGTGADRIGELREAADQLQTITAPARADADCVGSLINLAGAQHQMAMLEVDTEVNQERCLKTLRSARRIAWAANDLEHWAQIHNNMAAVLLERRHRAPKRYKRNIAMAREHCRRSLEYRAIHGSRSDWAASQITAAAVLAKSERADGLADRWGAIRALHRACRVLDAGTDPVAWAFAQHNLGNEHRLLLVDRDPRPGWRPERFAAATEAKILARALRHYMAAAATRSSFLNRLPWAESRMYWGDVRLRQADSHATANALEAYRDALSVFSPERDPANCRRAARRLGTTLARQREWPEAADTLATALTAWGRQWDQPMMPGESRRQLERVQGLARVAAYAMARAGRLEAAVEALETGRARGLERAVSLADVDLDDLIALDPFLVDRFIAARARIEEAALGERLGTFLAAEARAAILNDFEEVRREIRRLPGQADFLSTPSVGKLAAGIPSAQPLVYLVAIANEPYIALIVWHTSGSQARPKIEIYESSLLQRSPPSSELLYVHWGILLEESLNTLLSDVGEKLMRGLSEALLAKGAESVVLMPVGLISAAPLHATRWSAMDGREETFLDRLDVCYAPSGAAFVSALARARASGDVVRRFVALGNPLPNERPLKWAEAEVTEIRRIIATAGFAADESDTQIGQKASVEFFESTAGGASHLHLACHCTNDFDARLSSLELVDPEGNAPYNLAIDDKVLGGRSNARLVVLSACGSARADTVDMPDEQLSFPGTLLSTGAAGVIGTLWEVNDLPTTLLMMNFYERMLVEDSSVGHTPAPQAALCQSQRWLRDLTEPERNDFLARHPVLRAVVAQTGGRLPVSTNERPYRSPYYWSPFVLIGA